MILTRTLFVAAAMSVLTCSTAANAASCAAVFPQGTSFANSFTCGSGANLITTTGPGNGFTILDEGSGWLGEFGHGEQLLFDNGASGAVIVQSQYAFQVSSLDGYTSIQANAIGPYVATFTAYLAGNVVGVASYAGDNELGPEGTIPHFDLSAFDGSLLDSWTLSTTNDGLGFAYFYGVESVPEPTTWGLMLVGLGLAGAGLRGGRRQRIA
jgi:hypothetical protein